MPDNLIEQEKMRAEHILKSYNHMNCNALNISNQDLKYGLDFVQNLQKQADFPFLSANIVDESEKAIFPSHVIVEKNGIKFGIIGTSSTTIKLKDGLKVLDPFPIISKLTKKLGSKVDLIVLLANINYNEENKYLNELEDVDIIVQSGGKKKNHYALTGKDGKPIFVQIGSQGKYAAQLNIDRTAFGESYNFIKITKQDGDKYKEEHKITSRNKKMPLTETQMKDFIKEKKESGEYGANTIDFLIVQFDKAISDDPKVVEIFDQYKIGVKDINRKSFEDVRETISGEVGEYLGENVCKSCHSFQWNFWKQTGHAKAYATLVKEEKSGEKDCIVCHTTGYLQDGGFEDLAAVAPFQNVQCESCHGAGKGHVFSGEKIKRYVTESTCVKCHDAENDHDFNYKKDIRRMRCTKTPDL